MASLEVLKSSYRVVWRQDGAKQRETFDNRPRAEEFRAAVELAGNRWPLGWIPGHGELTETTAAPLFRDWAQRAIESRASANARTRHDYWRDTCRYLLPTFGDTPVDRITREQVGVWLNKLAESGLSPKTIKNIHNLASSILADAIDERLATVNPFRGRLRALPTVKQEEMVFLTRQEAETLLRLTPEFWRALVLLLFHTGLRWSEATALRVRDVDLLARRLRVVRAWKRTPDDYMVIGEPKSRRSRRTITISRRVAEALIPLTVDRKADALLFTTERGHRVSHSNFRYRVWVPVVRAMQAEGVEKAPRIHDARHSHASWLIADGANLVAVQRRLGHESIQTTIDRYAHLLPDVDESVSAALDTWTEPEFID